MAIYKSDIVDINLESGSIHRSFMKHSIGTADQAADRFGIRAFRNGEAVDLSGASCYGYFRDPQGNNIALTSNGAVDGNVAYVTLPQACYNYEGNFTLTIKLLVTGVTSTVRIIDGVVDNTNTGSAVAPTGAVPTYSEILSQYDDMVAATAVANGAIATTFNAATVYPAGSYVINDGALYRITADHAANVTWANTSKVATNFGAEVTALKSALSGQGFFNVNAYAGDALYTPANARGAIAESLRKKGMIITYTDENGNWKAERYINSSLTNALWVNNNDSWETLLIKNENNWVNGKAYANNNVGSAVTQATAATFANKLLLVHEGDKLFIRGYNATSYKLWATAGSDGKVIRCFDGTTGGVREDVVTIASGEKFLYCNTAIGSLAVSQILNIRITDTVSKIEEENTVYNLNHKLNDTTYTPATARAAVPDILRKKGLVITYKMASNIWRTEEYIGDYPASSTWANNTNWNVIKKGYVNNVITIAAYNSSDLAKSNADYVIAEESAGISSINLMIGELINRNSSKGKIFLLNGTYSGANKITGKYPYIEIEGETTDGVVINSSTGSDVDFELTQGVKLKNLTLTNGIENSRMYNAKRMENIKIAGILINSTNPSFKANVINVGEGCEISDLNRLFIMFNNSVFTPSETTRYEVHIYGHVFHKMAALTFNWDYVDYIGHNAIVELQANENVNISFQNGSYTDKVINRVENIHFLKTGCFNYYSNGAVMLSANNYKFVNCIFENATCSPTPFIQTGEGGDDTRGARRHGIVIDIHTYNTACRTSFHNCVGIGSPYGFQNTRGWYITWGSPTLYDCIGYGGGIGDYGHGIICHRSSNPVLINCKAFGGKHSYRDACGFRFQSTGSGTLIGCIGEASTGERYKSEGVPYVTLHTKCEELSISDESFFYDGTDVDYDGLTLVFPDDGNNDNRVKLLLSLTSADVSMVALEECTQDGSGFSFWSNDGCAKLMNCVGYAGAGENSCGIKTQSYAKPEVVGGYYGYKENSWDCTYARDTGETYQTITVDPKNLNDYTPYTIVRLNITVPYFSSATKLYVETIESTPRKILDGVSIAGIYSIGLLNPNIIKIPAGVKLKAYVTDGSDNPITITGSLIFHFVWCYDSAMKGAYISQHSEPHITDALITADTEGTAINIDTDGDDYYVRGCSCKTLNAVGLVNGSGSSANVFDCMIDGSVDSGISFTSKQAINGSSNYAM